MLRIGGAALLFCQALGSYDRIANYEPSTDVVPHSQIDLDMKEVVDALGPKDADAFAAALSIYTNGGGDKCTASEITGAAATAPCYQKTTNDVKGNSVGVKSGSHWIRTLKGFATCGSTCEAKLGAEKWYNVYKNYYGDAKYADTFVQTALTGTGDMASMSTALREQIVKKGIAYQGVWMYVLHEYEDAIYDCLGGDIYENIQTNAAGDSPHAWDEGWAFYAGSLEGEVGTGGGVMIYNLAHKRCGDFGTCKDGRDGQANANLNHLMNAKAGRNKILAGDCYTVVSEFDAIVDQMTIPLVQGMLKYAFKADPKNTGNEGSCQATGDNCDKAWAEGWAFAAAVLPRLNYCNAGVAKLVAENLNVSIAKGAQMKDGFKKLKAQVETLYECLGVTCTDMGAFQNSAGIHDGMEACVDPTPAPAADEVAEDPADEVAEDPNSAVVMAVAMLFLNAQI